MARAAQQEYGIHVETVTNLMPSLNDSDEHLMRLSAQIVHYLGERTPWHVTTYVPYAHMTHIAPTPPETLMRAREIGLRAGLRFVYTDNGDAPETAHTYCPACGTLLVERFLHHISLHQLMQNGTCAACGYDSGIIVHSSITSSQKGSL